MRMRSWFFILFAGTVNAEETCCVDKDIAAAFIQHATYSRDWPDSFPIELDNASVELIGSSTGRRGQQVVVAWKSELSAADARQLVADTLIQENWVAVPHSDRMQAVYQRGFLPHQPIAFGNNQQFCRDRDGQLVILARSTNIGTVVSLSHYANKGTRDCAGMIASKRVRPNFQSGLITYLPALKMPESVNMQQRPGSGSGGGSEDAHASLSLETSISSADLMASFSKQMIDQGWQMDTEFIGDTTSGHMWRRDVDGLQLVCFVTAVSRVANEVRLRMHLEPL